MPESFRRLLLALLLCLWAGFFPLLAMWRSNLGQVPAAAVLPGLLYTFLLVLAVAGGWLLVTRSPEKTVLLSWAVFWFVFSFGHLANLLAERLVFGVSVGWLKLFAGELALLAGACALILRARRLPDLRLLLLPAGALVLFNLAPVVGFAIQARSQGPGASLVEGASIQQPGQDDLPDVYFIVLDAYARDDVLRDVIGYDNSTFLDALRAHGFYIPECALSNYDGTVSALASVLNFDMLDSQAMASSTGLIHNNRASQVFRSYGYQFAAGRGYASFNDITSADVYVNYAIDTGIADNLAAQRFTSLYLNTTVFRVLTGLYQNNPEWFASLPFWLAVDPEGDPDLAEASFWYLQNNFMFDALATFPARPGPHFIYAHINAPHGPYVYRANGSFRYPLDDGSEAERYADALTYLNRRVLALVDTLLKESTPAPVIMIQGDHGIHNLTTGLDKHKILSAYYLPGELSTPPYPAITPVNNFRLVLRNYFDPSMPLLPDTLWVKTLNKYEPQPASCGLAK